MDERLRKELLRSELKERNKGKKIIRCKYRPKYPDSAEREYGMEFVGYTIRPFDVRLRKSTSLRMKRHLKTIQELYRDYEIDLDRARSTLMSYLLLHMERRR